MTQLSRAVSEQVATVVLSPSAVAIAKPDSGGTPAQTPPPPVPTPPTAPPQSDTSQPVSLKGLKAAAEQIESYLKANGRRLEFSIDDVSGETVITVRDSSTGEIVRQIPNAEALRLAHALGQQTNALIDISI